MAEVSLMGAVLAVHNQAYDYKTQLIFNHTEENDKLVDELECVKNLLAAINNDRKKSQSIDYSQDPAKKALVDKVREIDPNLIEPNCYVWKKGEHIDALIENLNNHSKHLVTMLNPNMMNITQLFQERNRITEIVTEIIRMYREESTAMVRNQRR